MTGSQKDQVDRIANTLLDARRTGHTLPDLPPELQPADMTAVYAVQDRVAEGFGAIGGWKIGAPSAEATPLFAPMPAAWMSATGSEMSGPRWRYRGLEAEIAFMVGDDLPPRPGKPYSREEALAAMASCHPVIEVLESAFTDPGQAARLAMLADLQMHGGFVFGPAFPVWRSINFAEEHVVLTVDGVVRVARTGSNTSGDLLKLIPWIANEGAERTGGLKKGQWITTGSWTGNTLATTSSVVEALFSNVGRVDLRFA